MSSLPFSNPLFQDPIEQHDDFSVKGQFTELGHGFGYDDAQPLSVDQIKAIDETNQKIAQANGDLNAGIPGIDFPIL